MQKVFSFLKSNGKEILFWLAITLLATLFFCNHPLDSDEGGTLNVAWQMWYHKSIYTNKFVEFISPGAGYIILWSWKIFGGPSYLVAKCISILLWLVSAICLSLIINQFKKGTYTRLIAILLWLAAFNYYPIINHNTFSSMTALIALLFLICATRQSAKANYWIVLTATFTAVTFWLLQTKGLLLFLAVVAIIFFLRKIFSNWIKTTTIYILSFIVILLILFFGLNLKEVFYSLFMLPQQNNYLAQNQNLFDPRALFLEIIILIVMVWTWLRNRGAEIGKTFLIIFIFQAALFISFLNNNNINHLTINLFPFIIFLAIVFKNDFKLKTFLRFQIMILLPALILNTVLINLRSPNILSLKGPSSMTQSSLIEDANYIYAGPFLPGFYFETNKVNPYAYPFMLNCNDACQASMFNTFMETQPEVAILNYRMVKKFDYSIENPLDSYILNNYKKCQQFGNTSIYSKTTCE